MLFSSRKGGPPGEGHWNDDSKLLTLYLVEPTLNNDDITDDFDVTLFPRDTPLTFGFPVENPSVPQASPALTVTIFQGLELSALATTDFDDSQAENDRIRRPLQVEQVYFTDSTELRQDSDNPGSRNTLHLFLSTDSDLRPQSRSYDALLITFSNMRGAMLPSGNVPLESPARAPDGITLVGEQDSKSYFKPAPNGAPGYAHWDDERKELKLWLARKLPSGTTLGVKFEVNNAVTPQSAPNITVATSGTTILFKRVRSECWPAGYGPSTPVPAGVSLVPGGYCLMATHKVAPPAGKPKS